MSKFESSGDFDKRISFISLNKQYLSPFETNHDSHQGTIALLSDIP